MASFCLQSKLPCHQLPDYARSSYFQSPQLHNRLYQWARTRRGVPHQLQGTLQVRAGSGGTRRRVVKPPPVLTPLDRPLTPNPQTLLQENFDDLTPEYIDEGDVSWGWGRPPPYRGIAPASGGARQGGGEGWSKFVLASMFVLGIGAGVTVDSVLNVEKTNVASREVIDRQTPNPDVCIANGMSALVLDQRIFISFNPFNVYVSQAEVKPGCVLRQSNWSVLESRGLVSSSQVQECKKNMNTFGFVGDLRQSPEVSCVYHSESAENQFLKDPSKATLGDGFQPKPLDD